ncbi:MAG: hypothetical protein COS87_01960, partial [Chloroflexi bacterium CG07_land_8_20_14_0_80_45_17]
MIPFISEIIESISISGRVFFDIFSGTTQVAQHFKKMGYHIISNDNLYFSYLLQRTYIENNVVPLFLRLVPWLREKGTYDDSKTGAQNVIDFLNAADAIKGYVFENYARDGKYHRMYFSNENAQKIDGILSLIELWQQNDLISEMEENILKTALIEAIPFVSNISGTYGAYLKHWDERAFKPLTLTVPQFILSTKQHYCFQKDANELIRDFDTDILYLDPPYNTRQYISNYHVLETTARNDRAELKGKTGLRKDDYLYKSKFSQEKYCVEALEDLIMSARAKYILMSYNSEGIIPEREIERIFKKKGKNYNKFEQSYRRFKSHSRGKTKGAVTEYIYFVETPGAKYYLVELEEQQEQLSRVRDQLPLFELARSRKFRIDHTESGIYDIRNKLNNLTGKEWVYRTNSVEILDNDYDEARLLEFMAEILETKYSTKGKESFSHVLRARNPAPKPPQLMKRLIDFF